LKTINNGLNTTSQELCIDGIPLTPIGVNFTEQFTKFLGLHIDETLPNLSQINIIILYAMFIIKQVKNIFPMDCSEHYILQLSILISSMAFLLGEMPALLPSIELLFWKKTSKMKDTQI